MLALKLNIIMAQPQVILLREGTDTSQGKGQLLTNISACYAIVDTVRSTLGPRGMDKLIVDKNGRVTISNDGATIMKLLDIVQPAAKTLVDIARSQDAEVYSVLYSDVIPRIFIIPRWVMVRPRWCYLLANYLRKSSSISKMAFRPTPSSVPSVPLLNWYR